MKVLKFGGTSVGSIDSILTVKKIVENRTESLVVVVSALGGVTDLLIATAHKAVARDESYKESLQAMTERHLSVIEGVVPVSRRALVQQQIADLLADLNNIYRGLFLVGDMSGKTLDTIVSYGEVLSSTIISRVIEGAELKDSREFIKTHKSFAKHVCDMELTTELIRREFTNNGKRIVVPGFISRDRSTGDVTNLGRGGSDYTASIIASALHADLLEIWTDVDGFMTADPRVIRNSYVIEELSFLEAMELCNFGAKVIYPPTIYPVYQSNIPIVIKNTFNSEAPGTKITHEGASNNQIKPVKGISSINDTALLTIQGLGMVGVIGVNYRIFKAIAKSGISVFMVSQAASENTTSLAVRNEDALAAVDVLKKEFSEEIEAGEINSIEAEYNLATVAIVGEGMKNRRGTAGKLFETLGRNGINVIACTQGSHQTNISFVVKLDVLRKTLNVLHESFFLSQYQVLNLFLCGVGTVGSSLIEQLRGQQQKLMVEKGLKINVVGIATSRRALFDREGVDLNSWKQTIESDGIESNSQILLSEILKLNIFNSVFVDCTASDLLPDIYRELLKHNVSVVTANKVAASSAYDNYRQLKETAASRKVKFLFETNVGAGLPIINTINSLINSGDRITKFEAVLSGTLNYIFNTISSEIPMSKAIRMAQEAGYAEPDPRIDLSGKDVMRKLVILARESGYKIEQSDVEANLFIDNHFFAGPLDQFWNTIGSIDVSFEERRLRLASEGKKWRFVASMEEGNASVGLQEVDSRHPFFDLEGSNNMILITTERYKDYPMAIKGYGAGASVTAAGVFADIISIANIR